MLEGLRQAIQLALEAEAAASGGASAAPLPKKRASAVECPTTGARALDAALSEKCRSAHTGALHKRCRLAQQEPVGCDISAAGC